jgi:hypothetical protein
MEKCMHFGVLLGYFVIVTHPIEFLIFNKYQHFCFILFFWLHLLPNYFYAGTSVIGYNTYLLVILISCEQQFFNFFLGESSHLVKKKIKKKKSEISMDTRFQQVAKVPKFQSKTHRPYLFVQFFLAQM